MTRFTISPFWQFLAWLMEKLGLDKSTEEVDEETVELLKKKGFTFSKEEKKKK